MMVTSCNGSVRDFSIGRQHELRRSHSRNQRGGSGAVVGSSGAAGRRRRVPEKVRSRKAQRLPVLASPTGGKVGLRREESTGSV